MLLPAFEAEGLLGLAVAMLPSLPPSFLIRNWAQYWGTLDRYLAHQVPRASRDGSHPYS